MAGYINWVKNWGWQKKHPTALGKRICKKYKVGVWIPVINGVALQYTWVSLGLAPGFVGPTDGTGGSPQNRVSA